MPIIIYIFVHIKIIIACPACIRVQPYVDSSHSKNMVSYVSRKKLLKTDLCALSHGNGMIF